MNNTKQRLAILQYNVKTGESLRYVGERFACKRTKDQALEEREVQPEPVLDTAIQRIRELVERYEQRTKKPGTIKYGANGHSASAGPYRLQIVVLHLHKEADGTYTTIQITYDLSCY